MGSTSDDRPVLHLKDTSRGILYPACGSRMWARSKLLGYTHFRALAALGGNIMCEGCENFLALQDLGNTEL